MKKTIVIISDFDFENLLENLIEEMTEIKNKYSNFSDLRFNKDYSGDYSYYELLGDREETEHEASVRKQLELNRLNANKERVRKEAEALGLL